MENVLYNLKNVLDTNFEKSINDNNTLLNSVLHDISIIDEIEKKIDNNVKIILKEILHDLETGLFSGINALYRNAYVSLRSAIELSLAYIYFIDHNYDYLFWQKDEFDLTWSAIKDENKGILRQRYLSLFAEDKYDTLIENYVRLYHECSQSVHGKYEYMFTTQLTNLTYSKDIFLKYIKMEGDAIKLIISILLIRHTNLYSQINEKYIQEIDDILKSQKLHRLLKILKETR